MAIDFEKMVAYAAEHGASDIFLVANSPPMMRVAGNVVAMDPQPLTPKETYDLAYGVMTERDRVRFEQEWERDIGREIPGVTRLRINIFYQRGNVGAVMRLIPLSAPSLDELGHPPVLKKVLEERDGLILLTGPTGSGKSTTLAAMLEALNESRQCTIVTIEDPIEYVHTPRQALFIQREVGTDTLSFEEALRRVLRQSPDVILIGEMRDVETFKVALEASETGHLVFSTVHARSATETMERIANLFNPVEKPQILFRLSLSLKAICSQKLVRKADGSGRVCAQEIMVQAPHVAKCIEEGRLADLYQAIKEGEYFQMQTMNASLFKFYTEGAISREEALRNAGVLSELRLMIQQHESDYSVAATAAP